MEYREFKIEATHDHTRFSVLVFHVGFFGLLKSWKSGFVYTHYFAIDYPSFEDAANAVEKYRERFSEIK